MISNLPAKIWNGASLALFAVASLPIATWYWHRVHDRSDEPLGLIALALFGAFVWERRQEWCWRPAVLGLGAVFLLAARWFLPPLPPLLGATCTLGILIAALILPRGRPGLTVLLFLSLPIMASLDFYAGAPMRLAAAEITRVLLTALGISVVRAGTILMENGAVVGVDPPCAGVRMLWTSLLVAGVLATKLRLSAGKTAVLLTSASALAVLGNSVRATLLFFPESGRVHWPEFLHDGAGLAIHGLTLVAIFALSHRLDASSKYASEAPSGKRCGKTITALGTAILCAIVLIGAGNGSSPSEGTATLTPVWPAAWDGVLLRELPLTSKERRFANAFPGEIARFQWGKSEMILRSVNRPTRLLHSSAGCLRASGFQIDAKPVRKDSDGRLWGCFAATLGDTRYLVRERITGTGESQGHTDVSAWYWSAWWNSQTGPWLAMTLIEPL